MIHEHPELVAHRPESIRALEERLSYHTVPLTFLRHRPPIPGSGVLLKIERRYFILTAGHCVHYAKGGEVATSIVNRTHRFYPVLPGTASPECDPADAVDVGYFVVAPTDARSFEAYRRFFCSLDRLHVTTSENLTKEKDWMVVGGYPQEYLQAEKTTKLTIFHPGMLTLVTMIAGQFGAPNSPLPTPRRGMQTIDLVMDVRQNQRIETVEGIREFTPPLLRGVSGGGCWRAFVQPNPSQWSANGIKLTGIHIASDDDAVIAEDGRPVRFLREVLIGHHLRMIANDFAELRETIYSKWPFLEDSAWDVPRDG